MGKPIPLGGVVALRWSWFWKDWLVWWWTRVDPDATTDRRLFNADYSWALLLGPLQVWRLRTP